MLFAKEKSHGAAGSKLAYPVNEQARREYAFHSKKAVRLGVHTAYIRRLIGSSKGLGYPLLNKIKFQPGQNNLFRFSGFHEVLIIPIGVIIRLNVE